jgi:L-iditol 2-dehydrogenase
MRIAELVEIGRIAFRDAERPTPSAGEILLRIRAVGLCGTDLKAYDRGHPYFRPPCVLGHEFSGTVERVGPGVERFGDGDSVVVAPYVECGRCAFCRRGLGELCRDKAFVPGALQEYVVVPRDIVERGTFTLPEGLGFAAGTLAEPLACAMNGIEKAAVAPGESVLVIGGGPMGALLATAARAITPRVLVSEISESRRRALGALGLPTANPEADDLSELLEERFGERAANRVLIAVGLREVAEEALGWTAPGGSTLLFGGLPKDERLTVDPYGIHYEEISLVGSFGFRADHFRAAVTWLAESAPDAAALVTDTVPFGRIEEAFQRARRAEGLKTVILMGEENEG